MTSNDADATTSPADVTSADLPPDCPPLDQRPQVAVPEIIDVDTEWSCQNLYLLPADKSFVADGKTLTINPGVVVLGQTGSVLVVTRGSKIEANGAADSPIVFTSAKPPGQRSAGDWGGVILLGSAPVNNKPSNGWPLSEDINAPTGYAEYGGEDSDSNCGRMGYVRIEFAGGDVDAEKMNGLGVGGCGRNTELHHLQVHRSNDDGIEFWGGAPVVHHVITSSNFDDGIDWNFGFSSNVQFLMIQHHPDPEEGDACALEGDTHGGDPTATPTSAPVFYNVTAVGVETGENSRGVLLRNGSAGRFYNSIFMDLGKYAVEIRGQASMAHAMATPPRLTFEHTLFFESGPGKVTRFTPDVEANDYFDDPNKSNRIDNDDPLLGDPYDVTAPNFIPLAQSVVTKDVKPPTTGFEATNYIGAFDPTGDDWTAGWAAYPEN